MSPYLLHDRWLNASSLYICTKEEREDFFFFLFKRMRAFSLLLSYLIYNKLFFYVQLIPAVIKKDRSKKGSVYQRIFFNDP